MSTCGTSSFQDHLFGREHFIPTDPHVLRITHPMTFYVVKNGIFSRKWGGGWGGQKGYLFFLGSESVAIINNYDEKFCGLSVFT
jgi:hypothetical protein